MQKVPTRRIDPGSRLSCGQVKIKRKAAAAGGAPFVYSLLFYFYSRSSSMYVPRQDSLQQKRLEREKTVV